MGLKYNHVISRSAYMYIFSFSQSMSFIQYFKSNYQYVNNPPAIKKTPVWLLDLEDPLEKG